MQLPLPENEVARLENLRSYAILATPPEQSGVKLQGPESFGKGKNHKKYSTIRDKNKSSAFRRWVFPGQRFFAEITDKRIRRGTFRSVGELVRAILDYIRRRNCSPQPFVWTASARSIARKVRHCNEALETGH